MSGCGEHQIYNDSCPWCWTANLPLQMTDQPLPPRICTCDPGPEGQHHEYCHSLDDR